MAGFPWSAWRYVALALAVAAVSLARNPPALTHPNLVAEDGGVFLADSFRLPWWESILEPYAGYYHLLPRVLAELLWLLPTASIPLAYALTSTLVTGFCLAWFFRPEARVAVPRDSWRACLVLLLAVCPHADSLGRLYGLQWYLASWLAMVCFFGIGSLSRAGVWSTAALALGTIWTAPATVVLFPLALYRAWKGETRRERVFFLGMVCSLAALVVAILVLRLGGEEVASRSMGLRDWAAAYLRAGSLHLLVVPVLGFESSLALLRSSPGGFGLLSGLLALSWAALLWGNRRDRRRILLALSMLATAILMAALIGARPAYLADYLSFSSLSHVRYFTAPNLLLWLAAATLLSPFAERLPAGRWRFLPMAAWAAFCLWMAGFGVRFNPDYQPPWFGQFSDIIDRFPTVMADHPHGRVLIVPSVPRYGAIALSLGQDQPIQGPGPSPESFLGPLEEQPDGTSVSWWMGAVDLSAYPWVSIPGHGRWCALGYQDGRYWFGDESGDLFWTGPCLFPRVVPIHFGDIRPISLRPKDTSVEAAAGDLEGFFLDLHDLGQGYVESPWFGPMAAGDFPLIWHPVHGLVLALRYSDGRYWFARSDGSVFWTAPHLHPQVVQADPPP